MCLRARTEGSTRGTLERHPKQPYAPPSRPIMKLNIADVRTGKLDGQHVWICDYRHKDIANKPIRHVEPQRVLVRANDDKLSVYYSESHFAKLKRDGSPTTASSGVIAPFDNTGYRSYPGEPLQVFDNERECREAYIALCLGARQQNFAYQNEVISQTNARISELNALITNQKAQIQP